MTNLEIAQAAVLKPISDIADQLGLTDDDFEPLGRHQGKLTYSLLERLMGKEKRGKLILVTAMTPTPKGEGKTTVTIGLTQGLRKLGKNAISATREPALGPVFGVKGGACGGGYSQVLPMEQINLFFTGDFPAITAAHNLISAMLDAHVHNGNSLNIDVRQSVWPRTLDVNDRALRDIVIGLGGKGNGFPRSDGFVITPASEIMAILCLASGLTDLKERVGRIHVALDMDGNPVTVQQLGAAGAATLLLKQALRPNLVQTIEGGPALVHGGPFGNIAHGCSSILATEAGLALGDYLITEAGFASDLGAEKFLDIKCRQLGFGPDAIVLVVTIKAIKHHGDGDLVLGFENIKRHIGHLRKYGPEMVVAINKFADDSDDDLGKVIELSGLAGVKAIISNPFGGGGEGCRELAEAVVDAADKPSTFTQNYDLADSAEVKVEKIVREVYGGDGIEWSAEAKRKLKWCEKVGLGNLPVCMAKTQNSLSDNPKALNAPTGFKVRIREVRPSAGAGFLVCVAGDIILMPGLGEKPAALQMDISESGDAIGLF